MNPKVKKKIKFSLKLGDDLITLEMVQAAKKEKLTDKTTTNSCFFSYFHKQEYGSSDSYSYFY